MPSGRGLWYGHRGRGMGCHLKVTARNCAVGFVPLAANMDSLAILAAYP